jgi:Hypoxia induced protein conserved region
MSALLIILILVAAAGAVIAVVRGLHAFANMQPDDVDKDGISKSLGIQNKMMFARVKWQAIAIILVVVLLAASQSR